MTSDQAELDLSVQQSFKLTDMIAGDEADAKAAVQSTISALAEIGAEDPAGRGGGAASGKAIVAAADDAKTDSEGDGDTSPLSEGIEDGVDIDEFTKHRVRDGEDIEAEYREQALTHKV